MLELTNHWESLNLIFVLENNAHLQENDTVVRRSNLCQECRKGMLCRKC